MTKKKPPRTPAPASSTPLIVVRDWLRAEAKAGHATSCPCCEQTVKIYPRKLSNATARALIKLWRLDEGIDSIKPEFREDADPTDPCTRPWTRPTTTRSSTTA